MNFIIQHQPKFQQPLKRKPLKKNMRTTFIITIFLLLFFNNLVVSISTDTLTISDSLSINETLLSKGGKFELGFFTRGNPKRYYVGIWYTNILEDVNHIVWVANRDLPCYSSTCTFKLGNNSNVVLLDGESNIIWQTKPLNGTNPVIQLLGVGNLVVREVGDSNPDNFLWESFDYPTDTIVAGQKIGWNLKTGLNRLLSSWRSPDDPGTGNFTFNLDYHGDPEMYLRDGDQIIYRSGPWVGERFSGVPEMQSGKGGFNLTFYSGPDEVYYTFDVLVDSTIKSGLMITYDGVLKRWTWVPDSNKWSNYIYPTADQCNIYRACGPNGACNASGSWLYCQCPNGFKPKNIGAWNLRDGSSGCIRKTKLDCESDGFSPLDNIKLPDTLTSYVDANLNLDECRDLCKKNCNCTAYANSQSIQGVGAGCIIWTDNLIDMRLFVGGGQTVYIRLAFSDLGSLAQQGIVKIDPNGSSKTKKVAIGVGICTGAALILAGLATFILWKRNNYKNSATGGSKVERNQEMVLSGREITIKSEYVGEANDDVDDLELPSFDIYSMSMATDNFSDDNKLGRGGFGYVYKGVMLDGKEVAVKRLSKESRQGAREFKNEVRLIAKLQHRNLVRLLGFCVEQDEKMLIYEYLENKSLDTILFDKERCSLLNWQKRFNIICGIARGLLYLHQDSIYRIIHRDLKASNILLDGDMNPKISDFGMARIFGGDETEGNTMKVVGTYGYMAPEYAMDGLFSIKSDVFSFGVLVLEILCGIKNKGFYNANDEQNLLEHVWKRWREGKEAEVLDKSIGDIYSKHEVSRCLQVGLLCVQERPEDRPTMASVVLMLTNDSTPLAQPKLPGFCIRWNPNSNDSTSRKRQDASFTVNQVTVTMLTTR